MAKLKKLTALTKLVVAHTIIQGLGPTAAKPSAYKGDIFTKAEIEEKAPGQFERLVEIGAIEEAKPSDLDAFAEKNGQADDDDDEPENEETPEALAEDTTGEPNNSPVTGNPKAAKAKAPKGLTATVIEVTDADDVIGGAAMAQTQE